MTRTKVEVDVRSGRELEAPCRDGIVLSGVQVRVRGSNFLRESLEKKQSSYVYKESFSKGREDSSQENLRIVGPGLSKLISHHIMSCESRHSL